MIMNYSRHEYSLLPDTEGKGNNGWLPFPAHCLLIVKENKI